MFASSHVAFAPQVVMFIALTSLGMVVAIMHPMIYGGIGFPRHYV
jgi:hypothetical protein